MALGDTALLVHYLAKYLDVELPYPLLLLGSSTSILHPTALSEDSEMRRFPLFKTNDPTESAMGMNLLNSDIVMLLESQDLFTNNSHDALGNLSWLLQVLISCPAGISPFNATL